MDLTWVRVLPSSVSAVKNNVLMFRPREAPKPSPRVDAPLWSMRKQASRIDCTIHDCGSYGWKAVFLINGDWFFSCRFDSWTAAIVAADKKHAELEQAGWIVEAVDASPASGGITG
jgi:hypothetical protein